MCAFGYQGNTDDLRVSAIAWRSTQHIHTHTPTQLQTVPATRKSHFVHNCQRPNNIHVHKDAPAAATFAGSARRSRGSQAARAAAAPAAEGCRRAARAPRGRPSSAARARSRCTQAGSGTPPAARRRTRLRRGNGSKEGVVAEDALRAAPAGWPEALQTAATASATCAGRQVAAAALPLPPPLPLPLRLRLRLPLQRKTKMLLAHRQCWRGTR